MFVVQRSVYLTFSRSGAKLSGTFAKFRGHSLKIQHQSSKGQSENLKEMSWDNPFSPIDAKNSIGFFGLFFGRKPGLLGDSVKLVSKEL